MAVRPESEVGKWQSVEEPAAFDASIAAVQMAPAKRSVPTLRRFGGGVLALALALWAQSAIRSGAGWDAILLYAAAVLLFVLLYGRATPGTGRVEIAPVAWIGSWWWSAGLGLSGVIVAAAAWQRFSLDTPSPRAWALHAASLILWLAAAYSWDLASTAPRETVAEENVAEPKPHSMRRHFVLLAGVIVLGGLLRVVNLEHLPFGTWYDEAANGLEALRIVREPGYRPLYTDGVNATGHYLNLIAMALKLFGVNTTSVRLVSALMGTAMVFAAYLAGREFFGPTMGLVAAAFTAVARWAINFSRLGMYNISTPLFALLAMALLLRGLRRGRLFDFALAGLALGLGLCFYAAFQLFVVVVGLFCVGLLILQWQEARKAWLGLLVMAVCAALVIVPVAKYAYERPESYFARVRSTSLFADKAPEERLPALWANTRKHLLMFHVRGDPNGRHNLPGEPMLDPLTGVLAMMGIALCLRRPYALRTLILPVWLLVALLGGILSLDFEAPQSLRAIGSMPPAYLMALLPLHELWREWRTGGGRNFPNFVVWLGTLLWVAVAYSNIHTYFVRQARDFASWNAFSTPETIAARLLNEEVEGAETHLISLYSGHPTVRFLTGGNVDYERLDTTAQLPILHAADKDLVLILDTERRPLFEDAQRIYPGAIFEEIRPPFGGPVVVYYVRVPRDALLAIQGLKGSYYAGNGWEGEPVAVRQEGAIAFSWPQEAPLPLPFSVEWEGVLAVESYGLHQFALEAPAEIELYIGEELILRGTEPGEGQLTAGVMLAEGNHNIRLRAVGGDGPVRLIWRSPNREAEIVPAWHLYSPPVTSNGLLGRYYANGEWAGPEAYAKIERQLNLYFHIPPLARPYTVEWTGKIAIPVSGNYAFGLQSIDEAILEIDGREVVASLVRNQYQEATVELTAGLHDIRLRYADRTDHTYVNLYWRPPGVVASGPRLPVPPEVLFPPQGSYERITLPNLPGPVLAAPGADVMSGTMQETVSLAANVETVVSGLMQPRGIALLDDGRVVVAETGRAQVLILAENGELLQVIGPPAVALVEPFEVATGPDGLIYILDAGTGEVLTVDGTGAFVGVVGNATAPFQRARGLDVDSNGRVWVANTPEGRAVALDNEGQIVQVVPQAAGMGPWEGMQPVDVLVREDGHLFITDAGISKLIQFDANGRQVLAWDILPANSLDSPHMARNNSDAIYLTEPESGRVLWLTPDGEAVGAWSVRQGESPPAKTHGVAVDSSGRLWVTDSQGGRVFRITPQSETP